MAEGKVGGRVGMGGEDGGRGGGEEEVGGGGEGEAGRGRGVRLGDG